MDPDEKINIYETWLKFSLENIVLEKITLE